MDKIFEENAWILPQFFVRIVNNYDELAQISITATFTNETIE